MRRETICYSEVKICTTTSCEIPSAAKPSEMWPDEWKNGRKAAAISDRWCGRMQMAIGGESLLSEWERERWPKGAPTGQAVAAAGLKRCHGEIHGLSTEAGAAALRACVILKLHKAERIAAAWPGGCLDLKRASRAPWRVLLELYSSAAPYGLQVYFAP